MSSGGRFTKDNQPEHVGRGKAKKTLMLEAIRDQVEGGEQEFLKRVVEFSIGHNGYPAIEATEKDEAVDAIPPEPPHPKLLALVLNRIEPPLKAAMPMVDFEFNHEAKPYEQASQVIKAISDGIISPDVGAIFISSVKSMLDIEESTELKARIEKLEDILNGESG